MLTHLMMCLYLLSLKDSYFDSLNDVLVLVESLTLVDVDVMTCLHLLNHSRLLTLNHLMMCLHLLSLKDSYLLIHLMTYLCLLSHSHLLTLMLNDVLALAESLTLVDVDSLNDVLVLVESLTLVDVDVMTCLHLLSHSHLLMLMH